MLKNVYPIRCGMDVHKSFIVAVACIATTNGQGFTTYMSKQFSTFTEGLQHCAVWLEENNRNQQGWRLPQAFARVMCPCIHQRQKAPVIRARYLNIKKRHGHEKAIIAIARMLLTAIYNILKKNEPYDPELFRRVDKPPVHQEVSVDEVIFILQRQGFLVTAPDPV